jgi:hypothetical protein
LGQSRPLNWCRISHTVELSQDYPWQSQDTKWFPSPERVIVHHLYWNLYIKPYLHHPRPPVCFFHLLRRGQIRKIRRWPSAWKVLPQWSPSVGMLTFPTEWDNNAKCSKPPTRYIYIEIYRNVLYIYIYSIYRNSMINGEIFWIWYVEYIYIPYEYICILRMVNG